jgi:hypothetical protein
MAQHVLMTMMVADACSSSVSETVLYQVGFHHTGLRLHGLGSACCRLATTFFTIMF